MKMKLRNSLTIAMTSLTILLCGYAVGFLLGEKKGKKMATSIAISPPGLGDQKAPWVQRSLEKFDQELRLSSNQKKLARAEITTTYDHIRKSRLEALKHYSSHIVDLHSRLLPHLDAPQKELVIKQRDALQETLDLGLQ